MQHRSLARPSSAIPAGWRSVLAMGATMAALSADEPSPAQIPPFWKSRLTDVDAAVKEVKRGEVRVVTKSPGQRNVYLVTYGPKQDFKTAANYNSAAGGRDLAVYARKDGTQHPVVFLLGPVHGGEFVGINGLVNLIHVAETGRDRRSREWPELSANIARCRVLIVPVANPDGRARCAFDSWVGRELAEYSRAEMGTRPDGQPYQWPEVKRVHPMRGDAVATLGGYFNDAGVNLMHDEWFDPMAPETVAWFRVAREEAPDFIVSLHSHASNPALSPTAYVSRVAKDTLKKFGDHLRVRHMAAELPPLSRPEPAEDGASLPPPAFNLVSALHHASGAVAFIHESPVGLRTAPYAKLTHDQLLDIQLVLYDELFKFALAHRTKWAK